MAQQSRNGVRNKNIEMNKYQRPEYEGVCVASPNGFMTTRYDGWLCDLIHHGNGQKCGGDMLWCYSMNQVRNITNRITAECANCHLIRAGLDSGNDLHYIWIYITKQYNYTNKLYTLHKDGSVKKELL